MTDTALTERPAAVDDVESGSAGRGHREWELRLEQHRPELTAYAYRMLGSAFEAEDAVQETFLRAWRGLDGFEGRAGLRSWLYRIANNVCLDMLNGRRRWARPMDPGAAYAADKPEDASPISNTGTAPAYGDPAEETEIRETVKLAFVTALQHLAPKQRAVLILREVLCWKASEVAELLHTSVASVNSALQRARWTLNGRAGSDPAALPMDEAQRSLLARYVEAFERYDMDALVPLLGVPTGTDKQAAVDR
jgi:RNA polymerase sigma-70 factor, ECF subfamily